MNALTPIEAADTHDMPTALAEAIGKIMAAVRNVEKHGENKFHNYKFARVEDLMFQVQPAMVEAGLVITQDEVRHEIVADSLMLATYAFSLSHTSGVTWGPIHQTGMAGLKNTKGGYDDKALNKCHTAARKYFILGLFQVPAGDLPDADKEEDAPAARRAAAAREDGAEAPEVDGVTFAAAQAAKVSIEMCRDLAQIKKWKTDNESALAEFPTDVADDIVRAFNAKYAELKSPAGAKGKPVEPNTNGHTPPPNDFGLSGDAIPQFN